MDRVDGSEGSNGQGVYQPSTFLLAKRRHNKENGSYSGSSSNSISGSSNSSVDSKGGRVKKASIPISPNQGSLIHGLKVSDVDEPYALDRGSDYNYNNNVESKSSKSSSYRSDQEKRSMKKRSSYSIDNGESDGSRKYSDPIEL